MNILIFSLILMPFFAAPISWLWGRKTKSGRDFFFRAAVLSEFILSLLLMLQTPGSEQKLFSIPAICGMGIHLTVDGFRSI